jgi:hypothetical protein
MPSAVVSIGGYNMIRCDSSRRRGDGVCLYVRKGLKFEIVHKSGCTGLEFGIVRVSICDVSLFVGLLNRAKCSVCIIHDFI